jgi:hypothetical protein
MALLPFACDVSAVVRIRVLCLLALMTVSCVTTAPAPSLPTYTVSGKVLLNQKPLVKALVVFHPVKAPEGKAYRSYAHTSADGSFTLSTFTPNDGAPAGQYRVTIQMQDEDAGPVRVPIRYWNADTSGIVVDIKPEATTLKPFELRSP